MMSWLHPAGFGFAITTATGALSYIVNVVVTVSVRPKPSMTRKAMEFVGRPVPGSAG